MNGNPKEINKTMPSGKGTNVHCKKPGCDGLSFKTISELRKHQWVTHPEMYKSIKQNLGLGGMRKKKSSAGKSTPTVKLDHQPATTAEVIMLLEAKRDTYVQIVNEIIDDLKKWGGE